jgi:hypothetical protein
MNKGERRTIRLTWTPKFGAGFNVSFPHLINKVRTGISPYPAPDNSSVRRRAKGMTMKTWSGVTNVLRLDDHNSYR